MAYWFRSFIRYARLSHLLFLRPDRVGWYRLGSGTLFTADRGSSPKQEDAALVRAYPVWQASRKHRPHARAAVEPITVWRSFRVRNERSRIHAASLARSRLLCVVGRSATVSGFLGGTVRNSASGCRCVTRFCWIAVRLPRLQASRDEHRTRRLLSARCAASLSSPPHVVVSCRTRMEPNPRRLVSTFATHPRCRTITATGSDWLGQPLGTRLAPELSSYDGAAHVKRGETGGRPT